MFNRIKKYHNELTKKEIAVFDTTAKQLNDTLTILKERLGTLDKEMAYAEIENEKEHSLLVLDTIRVSNENYKNVISENLYHAIKELTIVFEVLYNQ
nr:MAG TPA: hypothetical protein [Herelleviridae sp.]